MEEAIYRLFTNRQKDDLLLFYFSGHGIKDESGRLYLSTRSTRKENGRLFEPSAVAASTLHERINKSKSERQVLILDCCFSGAIAQGLTVKDDGSVNVQEHLGGKGRAILTASTSTQYSFEQEGSELSVYKRGKGNLSIPARNLLESKRVEWGISAEEAQVIEDEVLQPFREYQRKLQEYEQALLKTIEAEYPFSESTEADLKDYQQYLGLRDEDIAAIESRVIAPKKAEYELSIKQAEQQQTVTPSPSVGDSEASQIPPTPLEKGGFIPVPPLLRGARGDRTFEFEVATLSLVKKSGWFGGEKVAREIKRSRGRAEFFTEDLGNGVTLEMVAIPGGTFLMGSPESELERTEYDGPQHTVTIQPFFMGKFPVTQVQWQVVASLPKVNIDLKPDPSQFKGANRPVEKVSWYEAVEFCARLSQATGREYRLPSEAQWEYACRAGTTTPFYFGETISTDLANYCGEDRTINETLYKGSYGDGSKGIYREQTTEVGSFSANAFGLYDMHGNVWEWCADHWHDSYEGAPTDGSVWLSENENNYRLLRGGSWFTLPKICRSAYRIYLLPDVRNIYNGFRVVGVRG
jgi:formylglycine-generating enzyme required for sulfatase activity